MEKIKLFPFNSLIFSCCQSIRCYSFYSCFEIRECVCVCVFTFWHRARVVLCILWLRELTWINYYERKKLNEKSFLTTIFLSRQTEFAHKTIQFFIKFERSKFSIYLLLFSFPSSMKYRLIKIGLKKRKKRRKSKCILLYILHKIPLSRNSIGKMMKWNGCECKSFIFLLSNGELIQTNGKHFHLLNWFNALSGKCLLKWYVNKEGKIQFPEKRTTKRKLNWFEMQTNSKMNFAQEQTISKMKKRKMWIRNTSIEILC